MMKCGAGDLLGPDQGVLLPVLVLRRPQRLIEHRQVVAYRPDYLLEDVLGTVLE